MQPADKKPANGFTPYQKFVVGLLAFLQFAVILDFMLMAPLGALIMPALAIVAEAVRPRRVGVCVQRRRLAASLTAGLRRPLRPQEAAAVLLRRLRAAARCGAAWRRRFELLLAARIVTGLFGGVIGSIVLAIATDLFAPQHARPRDGHDPDRVRRQPGAGTADGPVPVEPLELARAVPRDGGARRRWAAWS